MISSLRHSNKTAKNSILTLKYGVLALKNSILPLKRVGGSKKLAIFKLTAAPLFYVCVRNEKAQIGYFNRG